MIILKTLNQIDGIRRSCQIVAYVLEELKKTIKCGITTEYLNTIAEDLCLQRGGTPAFKGYKGFPYSICASPNHKVVHGFPNSIPLEDGDLISIDFGVLYKGWYGDAAFTKPVGKISAPAKKLLAVGKECLNKGIKAAVPYCKVGDISSAIQIHAEKNKFNTVRKLVGHGIGLNLHELPQIPNFGKPHTGNILKPGSVIAIEPMVNMGESDVVMKEDGWTMVTKDLKLSVHFEHTIAITSDGTEILTKYH